MLPNQFTSLWRLSSRYTAKWMSNDGMYIFSSLLTGRETCTLHLKPSTYLAILTKEEEIVQAVNDLAQGVGVGQSTKNIHLLDEMTMEISMRQEKDTSRGHSHPCYGVYMLDNIIMQIYLNNQQKQKFRFFYGLYPPQNGQKNMKTTDTLLSQQEFDNLMHVIKKQVRFMNMLRRH